MSVAQFLSALDLGEYHPTFVGEGFDRFESLVEIQEEDFQAMGVKRGHRRLIQRELATLRGIPATTPLMISGRDHHTEEDGSGHESVQQTNKNTFYLDRAGPSAAGTVSEPGTKRKYRRHPKPDPAAPEKPPSAYVEFSNSVREEFKGKSFTEIARLVGEMWQNLPKEEKEKLEAHAAQEKIRYSSEMTEYKKTKEYADYQEYLAEFRKKHPEQGSTTPQVSASGDAGGPTGPTPPPLQTRSSGEESGVEYGHGGHGGHGGHPDGASAAASTLVEYRKRRRSGTGVESDGGAWERDREAAAAMRLIEAAHHEGPPRTVTQTSDLRSSARPALPAPPDSFERGKLG